MDAMLATPPPVLRAHEVARYLRLVGEDATPEELESARRTLARLVRDKRLRALRVGREYTYARSELEDFIAREIAAQPLAAPDGEGGTS